jgi:hypothetical protein
MQDQKIAAFGSSYGGLPCQQRIVGSRVYTLFH